MAAALTGAYANLLVVDDFHMGTNTLLAVGAVQSYLISVDCAFNFQDATGLALTAGLCMLLYNVNFAYDYLAFFGGNGNYLTGLTLIDTGNNDDGIISSNRPFSLPPYSTSGARDRIFR